MSRSFLPSRSLETVEFRCRYLEDRDYERTGEAHGEHAPEELGARRRCAVSNFGDASMPMLACFLARAGLARGSLAGGWRAGDNASRGGFGHCVSLSACL